jgi:hypothetical protein
MKNIELAHKFANGATTGKASNTKILDNKYYSYNTEIAIYLKSINLFVLSTYRYSNTTTRHQSELRQALMYNDNILCVELDLSKLYLLLDDNTVIDLLLDDNTVIDQIDKELSKQFLDLVKSFNLKAKKEIALKIAHTFEDVEKTKLNFTKLKETINNTNITEVSKYLIKIEESAKKREAKKREKALLKDQENLAKWLTFEFNGTLHNLPLALIRVKNDEVETTSGAKVPLDQALKLKDAVKNNLDVSGVKIGNYTVNYVDGNVLKIGCHKIDIAKAIETLEKL